MEWARQREDAVVPGTAIDGWYSPSPAALTMDAQGQAMAIRDTSEYSMPVMFPADHTANWKGDQLAASGVCLEDSSKVIADARCSVPNLFSTQITVQGTGPQAELLGGLCSSLPADTALTPSQRKELELAKQRAERAAASRSVSRSLSSPSADWDTDVELLKLSPDAQYAFVNESLENLENESEAKKLKRLLRNRLSAQQARERKKKYVGQLEHRIQQQLSMIRALEVELQSVKQQNTVLRRLIINTQPHQPAQEPSDGVFARVPDLL